MKPLISRSLFALSFSSSFFTCWLLQIHVLAKGNRMEEVRVCRVPKLWGDKFVQRLSSDGNNRHMDSRWEERLTHSLSWDRRLHHHHTRRKISRRWEPFLLDSLDLYWCKRREKRRWEDGKSLLEIHFAFPSSQNLPAPFSFVGF